VRFFHICNVQGNLGLSDKRVLKGIFGFKKDEIIESWRKLHNGTFIIVLLVK
jgi:hypothetical protein